jgi:hypothetical protein
MGRRRGTTEAMGRTGLLLLELSWDGIRTLSTWCPLILTHSSQNAAALSPRSFQNAKVVVDGFRFMRRNRKVTSQSIIPAALAFTFYVCVLQPIEERMSLFVGCSHVGIDEVFFSSGRVSNLSSKLACQTRSYLHHSTVASLQSSPSVAWRIR